MNNNRSNPLYRKWFMKGLIVKLLGSIAFCLVYTYYYEYGGDTRGYFRDSQQVIKALSYGIEPLWNVISRNTTNINSETLDILIRLTYDAPMEYYTVNIGSVFTLLGLGSYFSASLLISLFSYWGIWSFFILFTKKYPKLEKQLAFAILFVPSVVFWGSGFSKDTFVLCFVGLTLFYADKLFSGRVFNLKYIFILITAAYLLFVIKAYVLISLLPAILIWRTLHFKDKIRIKWLRNLVLPIFGLFSIVAVVYSLNVLSQFNKKYSVNNFVNTAQSMQGWHYVEGHNSSDEYGRGSSYTLGNYEESTVGLLKIFPKAVNATFFRPYLWEAKNAAMLAQAIESTLFLLFALYTLLKIGPIRIYNFIADDSLLLMCLVFAIFFGFAIGFSTYNFGALSRYKIQCVPFFLASLFILLHKAKEVKELRKARIRAKRGTIKSGVMPGYLG